jgi:hypothetical protein
MAQNDLLSGWKWMKDTKTDRNDIPALYSILSGAGKIFPFSKSRV